MLHEVILFSLSISSVLRHSLAQMLTGVTWQVSIIILVLIEVLINLILMLIEFHVIKGNKDHICVYYMSRKVIQQLTKTTALFSLLQLVLRNIALSVCYSEKKKKKKKSAT